MTLLEMCKYMFITEIIVLGGVELYIEVCFTPFLNVY